MGRLAVCIGVCLAAAVTGALLGGWIYGLPLHDRLTAMLVAPIAQTGFGFLCIALALEPMTGWTTGLLAGVFIWLLGFAGAYAHLGRHQAEGLIAVALSTLAINCTIGVSMGSLMSV